ncbi:hypothetical protein ACO2RV_11690 [Ancylobacter sp. VNQ12]|uniref:hypothetical protein n=1 Tax=Ancylobacter sp. VNQ12 TaxID=3400920 RepID=UPI003C0E23E2
MSPPDDAARAERLAAALRENLKRRKTQARARVAAPSVEGDGEAPTADSEASRGARDGKEPAR